MKNMGTFEKIFSNDKKELEKLGFRIEKFCNEPNSLIINLFYRTSNHKNEALIHTRADTVDNETFYKIVFHILDDSSENKKLFSRLENELNTFEKGTELSLYKYNDNLFKARLDLLTLARAYNKVFIK